MMTRSSSRRDLTALRAGPTMTSIYWATLKRSFGKICHAEANAIFNVARTGVSTKGATIFVTKFPCFGCCNAIVQAGIRRIYTHDHRYWDDDPADKDHSRKEALLKQARIHIDAPFHPKFSPAAARFASKG